MKNRTLQSNLARISMVILSVGVFLSVQTFAQTGEYSAVVKQQLDTYNSLLAKALGLSRTHNEKYDKLRSGETDSLTLNLTKGKYYVVLGACDQDCSDLDLKLYDISGKQVAQDTKNDSLPTFIFTPPSNGAYSLKVHMYNCSSNPCYYGITAFGD